MQTWYHDVIGCFVGVGSLSERVGQVEEQRRQDAAATCIQAVYRGHTVRQGLGVSVKSDGDTQRSSDTKHQVSTIMYRVSWPGCQRQEQYESVLTNRENEYSDLVFL